ncbi:MAG TPA: hypothetical protein VNL18_00110 [Gemmatimonadales bacterium]|nr:hypothetical protein [Gemmatimonadales bacterium]
MILFHRTTIGEARSIVEQGFRDSEWDFGLRDAKTGEDVSITGVWLADRALGEEDGLSGDALLEVDLDVADEELQSFELQGLLWNGRFWVAPADFVNKHGKTRILTVDPRSSWGWRAINDSGDAGESGSR